MTLHIRIDADGIALLTIDNPPVNALGQAMRADLLAAVHQLDADAAVRAVVLTGAGKLFVGGADITEFDKRSADPQLPDVLLAIEGAQKPWIAALHGMALGGGLELALACAWRVAVPGAKFGLPEVNLGIIPGAGGSQRLPRLIGVEAALPVVAENRQLTAEQGVPLGLIDHLVEGDLVEGALAFARHALDLPRPQSAAARAVADPGAAFWAEAEARVKKAAKGLAAQPAAVAALRKGVEAGFAAGIAQERATFLALKASDEAAALRHIFFAERAAPRPPELKGITPRSITRAGVVGGGTMGVGIAAALRNAGLEVVISERDDAALATALSRVGEIFDAAAKRGLISAETASARRAGVTGSVGLDGMAGVQLVVEAVFEDIAVKREVFAELGRICPPETILATNTSYIDPRQIFAGIAGAERCIGLHFFSPAHVMKLLEIIPLPDTAPEVLATSFELARRMGKMPVRAGICEGFIGNRILKRYRAEAEAMLAEGISHVQIDAAMRAFGHAMGPFEMQDLAGLDISFRNREAARARGEDLPETPGDLLVRAGRLGQKSGGGWYDYTPGARGAVVSDTAAAIIAPLMGAPHDPGAEAISGRILDAMADEGQAILSEGIAAGPEAIDLVQVHGYGFPRGKGGPMFRAGRRARG